MFLTLGLMMVLLLMHACWIISLFILFSFNGSLYDSPDGTFYLPDNFLVDQVVVDTEAASTMILENSESYRSAVSFNAEVNGEASGVEGTGTLGYQNVKSTLATQSVRIGFKEYTRGIFKVTPTTVSPTQVKLDANFLADVNSLPLTYSATVYSAFLSSYGLYFFNYIKFGVSATITSYVQDCLFQVESSQDVTAGLEASAESAGVGAKASIDSSNSAQQQCLQRNAQSSISLLGGDFSKFDCNFDETTATFICTGTWNDYAATAIYQPWRIEYQLTRISALIANSTIAANIDTAISAQLSNALATKVIVYAKNVSGIPPCPCSQAPTSLSSFILLVITIVASVIPYF
jgi:hypothetical protein